MPHNELPLRSLFLLGRTMTKYGLIAYGLGRLGVDLSLGVPDGVREPERPLYEPGWLETRNPNRPALIVPDMGGHKNYLTYMAANDPALKEAHRRAFTDVIRRESDARPALSETIYSHLEYAWETLRYTTARLPDVVHVAMFTLASVHSNYYTYGDVRGLGVRDKTSLEC